MAEQKNNQGVAFWNNYKNKDNQPDFTGTAIVDGKPQSIGIWFSKSQGEGKLYLYLTFSERQELKTETSEKSIVSSNDDNLSL